MSKSRCFICTYQVDVVNVTRWKIGEKNQLIQSSRAAYLSNISNKLIDKFSINELEAVKLSADYLFSIRRIALYRSSSYRPAR